MSIESRPSRLQEDSRPVLVAPALEALLSQSTLHVEIVAELHRCGSWFLDEPRYDCGLFHLVGDGSCVLESDNLGEAMTLHAGDLIVFPHGDPHRLSHVEGQIDDTSLICGELHFPALIRHPLEHALPRYFVVRAAQASEIYRQLATTMVEAVHSELVGRQLLLNKLADTLFALAVCDYAKRSSDRQGLFAALADQRICRALQAVHEDPGHPWTMQRMAAKACMSRSAFAERFVQLMDMPPIQYVTQWRVNLADQLLRTRRQSVAAIAEQLGYGSEAAFRRLFKRVSGVSPGQLRSGVAKTAS